MRFEIYETGKKTDELSFYEFIDFYYNEFGSDCGNPSAIANALEVNQGCYIGKGYTVIKSDAPRKLYAEQTQNCSHNNKYLNKITTGLQFYVCPDCKQEV